jgi:hypothetical protein
MSGRRCGRCNRIQRLQLDLACGPRCRAARSYPPLGQTPVSRHRKGFIRDLLAPVYGWFTEGFDTLDLKEAKTLLDARWGQEPGNDPDFGVWHESEVPSWLASVYYLGANRKTFAHIETYRF